MREVLHHQKFEDSKATEELLLMPWTMKSWLDKFNKNLVYHAFTRTENLIRGLKDEKGNLIINSRKELDL